MRFKDVLDMLSLQILVNPAIVKPIILKTSLYTYNSIYQTAKISRFYPIKLQTLCNIRVINSLSIIAVFPYNESRYSELKVYIT